jgi:hypothetical protein
LKGQIGGSVGECDFEFSESVSDALQIRVVPAVGDVQVVGRIRGSVSHARDSAHDDKIDAVFLENGKDRL